MSVEDSKQFKKINIFIIGDPDVGKTSLMIRYDKDEFYSDKQHARIGLDYISKLYLHKDADEEVMAKVWDTAGQEKFRSQTVQSFRTADGIILVFDKSREDTFNNVKSWHQAVEQNCSNRVPVLLVGNKCDLK